MAELTERVTALEVAQRYEIRAREQDQSTLMSHNQRLHHIEALTHNILTDGSKRDRRLGHLEAVADEAIRYRDRILFAQAGSKYLVAVIIIGLYLSGRLSGEQVAVIRAWFSAG